MNCVDLIRAICNLKKFFENFYNIYRSIKYKYADLLTIVKHSLLNMYF